MPLEKIIIWIPILLSTLIISIHLFTIFKRKKRLLFLELEIGNWFNFQLRQTYFFIIPVTISLIFNIIYLDLFSVNFTLIIFFGIVLSLLIDFTICWISYRKISWAGQLHYWSLILSYYLGSIDFLDEKKYEYVKSRIRIYDLKNHLEPPDINKILWLLLPRRDLKRAYTRFRDSQLFLNLECFIKVQDRFIQDQIKRNIDNPRKIVDELTNLYDTNRIIFQEKLKIVINDSFIEKLEENDLDPYILNEKLAEIFPNYRIKKMTIWDTIKDKSHLIISILTTISSYLAILIAIVLSF